MTDREPVTAERIDELLRFLPRFERGEALYGDPPWIITPGRFPYPVYSSLVNDFFATAAQPWWLDTGYNMDQAGTMLSDPARVEHATLDEVRQMLTYCVRSERFGDGAWGALIEHGSVTRLLRRLAAIRQSLT